MKRVALVGMPNTGKSTLFNRITGGTARTANWPGLTVELASSRILLGGSMVQMVDLPGIYDLSGGAEDERLAQEFLNKTELDAILLVLNATQLDRQLVLALQLKALGAPLIIALNMSDEAKQAGVQINVQGLAEQLACPVLKISAKHGLGISELKDALNRLISHQPPRQIDLAAAPRSETLHDEEARLYARFIERPAVLAPGPSAMLDRWILHPWLGLPIFVLMMFCLFQLTYALGVPLQDAVGDGLEWFKQAALVPAAATWPPFLAGLLVNGVYDGLSTVLTFIPIIFLFFCLMAIIEDSGYFSRAAFMMDGLMARLGMDGRGFVMLMMGFGCNVPALMATRVIRDRKARLLTMLAIPFSLCSARLQIFLFLTGALFSPLQAPWVLLSLYFASIFISMGTALLLRGRFKSTEPFTLELPPYRFPVLRQIFLRGWGEAAGFVRLATTMIVIGVVLVWLLSNYPNPQHSYSTMIAEFFQPVLSPIGIQAELSIALMFGFVAKEVVLGALAVIAGQDGPALAHHLSIVLDPVSAYSFMLFSLTYVPCVSTIAAMRKESNSVALTTFSVVYSLLLAWVLSFIFYQGARILGF
ncbi:ferrous iron transport protein B [Iodobacter arcticus]|uniref:Ferrous iron transport protein B n=1 Tax=Iodobacter arcticus TaxID=590593 RepID=A0ABW2QV89_9NEIS